MDGLCAALGGNFPEIVDEAVLMLESVLTMQDGVSGPQESTRQRVATISPGLRGGWTLNDSQIILGAAVPVTFTEGEQRATAFLMYVSYELPFSANR